MNLESLNKEKLLDILEDLYNFKSSDEKKNKQQLIEKIKNSSNYDDYVQKYKIMTSRNYYDYLNKQNE